MKILVINGSPHKNGSTRLLADAFARGAEDASHEVNVIDVAAAKISPCIGCKICAFSGLPCVLDDDMSTLKKEVLSADMLVFATPLYYFAVSAQLKLFLDRCCAINLQITQKHMKAALLAAAWNEDDWTMCALESHYKTLCKYMQLEDMGMVLGIGCGTVEKTKASRFPQMAHDLGKQLV